MPLRDHFHAPLDDETSWDGLHGQWPAMIVMALAKHLPSRYVAAPHIHTGPFVEVDVATYDHVESAGETSPSDAQGGTATALWAPPQPTFDAAADLPEQDEYEVRVYDVRRNRRLVAAIEIISPANKDRPEHRRAFVAKCAALLQQRVCVALVDLVTAGRFNLYDELLKTISQRDPTFLPESPATYCAACRWTRQENASRFEAWAHPLDLGKPLPTLPLWLADNLAVPLELDASYEETCRILRIT